jgi:hypothetical protein
MMKRWFPVGALCALAAGVLLADTEPRPADIDSLLGRIKNVGREGASNPDAARAVKALVARGPVALVPILAAMNDDELVAANWLRPAFEAIAEKAHKDGTLSEKTLESFVGDKKRAGIARRLAYEWLVKLDKTAPERLLPGMVQDPSPELRRDAIDALFKKADAALGKKDDRTAREAYQKALTGAGDPEQIDTIVKALDKLGEKVDRQKVLGVVTRWHLIAPFEHTRGTGWDVAYPPEKSIDFTATYKGKDGAVVKWVDHKTTDPQGLVDLNKTLGKSKGAVAYACALVDSPNERAIELRAGCINGLKIFLNGKQLFAREEYHHGMRIDQYAARGTLKKGPNTILLKVCQNEQEENWAQNWTFQLRLCDFVGAAVPFSYAEASKKENKR